LGDVFLKVLSSHKLQESCLLNRNDFYTSIKRLLSTTKEAVTLSAPLTQALYNILDIVFGNDSSSPREKVFQIISNSFQHKWDASKCWLQLKFLLEQFSNADAQSLLDSSPSSIPQFIVSAILCSITRISDTQQSPQQSLQGIESGCLWPGVYHAWLTTLGRDLQNNFLAAVQQILQSPALLNGSGSLYQQLMENRYLHITTEANSCSIAPTNILPVTALNNTAISEMLLDLVIPVLVQSPNQQKEQFLESLLVQFNTILQEDSWNRLASADLDQQPLADCFLLRLTLLIPILPVVKKSKTLMEKFSNMLLQAISNNQFQTQRDHLFLRLLSTLEELLGPNSNAPLYGATNQSGDSFATPEQQQVSEISRDIATRVWRTQLPC
jgi:hypothetical protein